MDMVRGAAAIVVMLGHSRDLFFSSLNNTETSTSTTVSGPAASPKPHRNQISMGNEAVMIFFVLSGYLVGGSVLRSFQRDRWSWKDYLSKRLARLWVVLLPALALTIVIDILGLKLFTDPASIYRGPAAQSEVRAHLISTLAPHIVIGNIFFLQKILVPVPGTNIALWSLTNEFWYYLLFPLLIYVCWRSSTMIARVFSALMFTAILFFVKGDIAVLFLPWLFGAAIALLPLKLTERTSWWMVTSLSALLVPVMILIRRFPLDVRLSQMCMAVYFSVLLYAMVNRIRPARQGLYPRFAGLLSDLSYPLYLVHLPIIVFLCACTDQPWRQWTKSPAHLAMVVAIDASAMLVAYIFHLCFQRHTDAVRLAVLGVYARVSDNKTSKTLSA
jgi:peptidoglycan/LPS O-acetylase OafA/YrhL